MWGYLSDCAVCTTITKLAEKKYRKSSVIEEELLKSIKMAKISAVSITAVCAMLLASGVSKAVVMMIKKLKRKEN